MIETVLRKFRRNSAITELQIRVRIRRIRLRFLKLRQGHNGVLALGTVLSVAALSAFLLVLRWNVITDYIDGIDHAVFPSLAVAIAAAMLGVIGIVFSLSIFSVQQVADRGTSLTLREYSDDWVLKTVFWLFAFFACAAAGVSLLSTKKPFSTAGVITDSVILVLTCILLKVYFNRVIKFADAHYTIAKMEARANKYLSMVQSLQDGMYDEYRLNKRSKRLAKK